jgi:hypothetical protein
MKGDGTFVARTRATRFTQVSQYTFNNSMHGFLAPATLDQAFNLVRVTIHPPTIDAAATTVLYADSGTPRQIAPGDTVTIWATYRDPGSAARTLIGGLSVTNPLVAGVNYAGNSQADGLGANLTGSLVVTITPFATVAMITVQNTNAASVYLVNGSGQAFLNVTGKGVYDLGPQTYQSQSTQGYGTRPLDIGMSYQSNAQVASDAALFVRTQRESIANQPDTLTFIANSQSDFMTQALAREPGDVITVTEPVTGYTLVQGSIQSVAFTVTEGPWVIVSWKLAPISPYTLWLLGVAGASELGVTTILGF